MQRTLAFAAVTIAAMTGAIQAEESQPSEPITVKVGNTTINTVNPLIFGDNIEWYNNGMFLFDPESKTLYEPAMKLLKEVGLTHMRYPGGSLGDVFDWREAVGEKRVEQPSPFPNATPQVPHFGPDEYADFCKAMGVKQTITFNAGPEGTPEMAAAWVKHCKEKGYDVLNYCLGNEIYMENSEKKTPAEYRDLWLKTYEAIEHVAPGTPLGAVGGADVDDASLKLVQDQTWLDVVIPGIKDKMAFLDIHNAYAPIIRTNLPSGRLSDDDFARLWAGAAVAVKENLDLVFGKMEKLAGEYWKDIEISISEGGPLVYVFDPAQQDDMKWNTTLVGALYQATLYNLFTREPKIAQFNHMPFYQAGFHALVGLAPGEGGATVVFKNIIYDVTQLYAQMKGREVLETAVDGPVYSMPAAAGLPPLENVAYVDAAAFRKPGDAPELAVFLINRDIAADREILLEPGYDQFEITEVARIASDSYLDSNSAAAPDNVRLQKESDTPVAATAPYKMTLPKHSLTLIRLRPAA